MKILLSAYACEPNKGSEPFLGWRWAKEISKHHDVWIVTKGNNRPTIEEYLKNTPINTLHFIYVDLHGIINIYKKGNRGLQLYYYFWQRKAYKEVKLIHDEVHFDIVHHLTFGAYTQPTFMWKLGVPFVWGPLGGGERMPKIKGRKLNMGSFFYELLRIFQMNVYHFFPFTQKALKLASKILVTTEETYNLIPSKYHDKCILFQSLGIDYEFMSYDTNTIKQTNRLKILAVGRMIGWKGFDIVIDAFKYIAERYDNVDLYLRGNGNMKNDLIERCESLYNKRIFFTQDYLNYNDMYGFYKSHDIFINCSLHDSGCLVVLEAMSAGLPIVCINVGGPHVITTEQNAIRINVKDYKEMIQDIVSALSNLIENKDLRNKMGEESVNIIKNDYLYEKKYKFIEQIYKEILH